MARINSERVADKLNYHKNIKGKRLIRLSAGVCSGKNYWVKKTAKENPQLRILFITSRKNTVVAQANKMEADTFINLDNISESDLSKHRNIVCTNATIEKFFKFTYDKNNPDTFLWDKFDLIVLDEAHALTTDATFTDNFYTERFLKHTYYKNPNCDIIFMSGTIIPLDWMLGAKNTPHIHDINLFDDCVHLEPKDILVINEQASKQLLLKKLKNNERVLYFANHKDSIGKTTKWLISKGIAPDEIGFSFNYKAKDRKYFPEEIAESLDNRITKMNKELTKDERIPSNIKILFSTSKNKEGINILDDDIKITFVESHNKSELVQMAGRVRGNEETGEGIDTLVIISDAKQHLNYPDEFKYFMNKKILKKLDETLVDCLTDEMKHLNIFSPLDMQNKLLDYKGFRYILYDFIKEEFAIYEGRIEGERQHTNDLNEFNRIISENIAIRNGKEYTGAEILKNEWFNWSDVYILHKNKDDIKRDAGDKLREFLYRNEYIGVDKTIGEEDRDVTIKAEIKRLADFYGYNNLGLKEGFEKVGSALKKFDIQIKEVGKAKGYKTFKLVDVRG